MSLFFAVSPFQGMPMGLCLTLHCPPAVWKCVSCTSLTFLSLSCISIAEVLSHSGQFEFEASKRYSVTDLLMREMWENEDGVYSERGQIAVQRTNAIHAQYGDSITNDDMLFTLAGFMLEPSRVMQRFATRRLLQNEVESGYLVWKEIGEAMGIRDIPATVEKANDAYDQYEDRKQAWSASGQALTEAAMNMIVEELPAVLRPVAKVAVCALLDEGLLRALKLPSPSALIRFVVETSMVWRSFVLGNFVYPLPETKAKRRTPQSFASNDSRGLCPMYKTFSADADIYELEQLGSAPKGVLATTLPTFS
jgi:hypothetical protein